MFSISSFFPPFFVRFLMRRAGLDRRAGQMARLPERADSSLTFFFLFSLTSFFPFFSFSTPISRSLCPCFQFRPALIPTVSALRDLLCHCCVCVESRRFLGEKLGAKSVKRAVALACRSPPLAAARRRRQSFRSNLSRSNTKHAVPRFAHSMTNNGDAKVPSSHLGEIQTIR